MRIMLLFIPTNEPYNDLMGNICFVARIIFFIHTLTSRFFIFATGQKI